MSQVACEKHTLMGPSAECVGCVGAERDVWKEEAKSMMACLETPESKLFDDHVDPFISKMLGRGVRNLDDPALRYHLALLVKRLIGASPTLPAARPQPENARMEMAHLALRRTPEGRWFVLKNRLGTGDLTRPLTQEQRDELVVSQRHYYEKRNQPFDLYEIDETSAF